MDTDQHIIDTWVNLNTPEVAGTWTDGIKENLGE
jgi:hypothetical protein